MVDGFLFGTWIGGSFWKGFSRGLDLASSMGGSTIRRSIDGDDDRSRVTAMPTLELSDGESPPGLLELFDFVMGETLSARIGHGPVGRMSIDLRIRSSKLSLLLLTSSTGGNMCKVGPAAIVKS
jgi:hypothetical protein